MEVKELSDIDSDRPPFIKWGNYKSNDPNKSDILECKVIETETFPTEYSENVKIYLKENDKWQEKILTLASHDSDNKALLHLWTKAVKAKKLKKGKTFYIKTWLGISKNNRAIRRWDLEI
jgi:hypothetical protein